tara:strand:+ start:408 stop:548 length:141 start_codon:yes stop_codon:yes gene_type:complete
MLIAGSMVELHNTLSKFMVDRMKWLESTNVGSCYGLVIKNNQKIGE